MMDVLQAIERRREITAFKPDPIPAGVLDRLKRALYLAPAGNNLPSREFIVVTDRAKLDGLAETTPWMRWLGQTPCGVAIVANPQESKYWLQDASIAGAFLWLAATAEGLGAAWGAVYHSEDAEESARRESHVRRLLGVPDHYRVVAVIGLGYPAAQPPAKAMYPPERVLHRETFGQA